MSELTLVLVRFAYLALLWILVLSAISVVRSDLFGARVDTSEREERRPRHRPGRNRAKPARRSRREPTHVAIVEGTNAGETIPLDDAPLLIGRSGDAAIRLDDDYVSTRHARIGSSDGQWYVEDLGSTNGTYLAGQRITQPVAVQLGSQVRVGKTTLELRK